MNREIQTLLADMQKFAQKAVEELQKGNNEKSSFFFNVVASLAGQLAELSKGN